MNQKEIKELVSQMTLEEKASLCSGADFWHTKAVERLGVPAIMMSDGPFGLRKQEQEGDHLGMNESIPAVCFPAGVATASSFNRELAGKLGETLGKECQSENIGILLGPAMNIKRSPLCGRNFEYYSEDPFVSAEMAAAYMQGLQNENVGACPKHFYANNMESLRSTASSEMDERTKHEIYLASFENAVRKAKPWSVMAAYNRINGVYACENKEALDSFLRQQWGFEGIVISDWTAVNDRVADLAAGLDLEMPSTDGITDKRIVKAVNEGIISQELLDEICGRILKIIYRYTENHNINAKYSLEDDHKTAREIAEECMVLLKNDGILPLDENQKIAFIGKYAKKPRYQGGGSSHINSFRVECAWDCAKEFGDITYAQGFNDKMDEDDEGLLQEAVETAEKATVAVLFVGLPDSYESEGYDRKHMRLPQNQDHLIEEICKVQKNVIVVLHNGSPVEMPWISRVNAVLESYLCGQAVGRVQADILFGRVNPSGKLAESFPLRLQDTPSYLNFQVNRGKVHYTEGIFVGYRYYDSRDMDVLFPFGHGLSYTTFSYENLCLSEQEIRDTDTLTVRVDVKNTGSREGKEVVQLYVTPAQCDEIRPSKELKGFEKISLKPGETRTVTFTLDRHSFAYWDTDQNDWFAPSGTYGIAIGASSRDIRLNASVQLLSTVKRKTVYTADSVLEDILKDSEKAPVAMEILRQMNQMMGDQAPKEGEEAAITNQLVQAMLMEMPLRNILGNLDEEGLALKQLLEKLNA